MVCVLQECSDVLLASEFSPRYSITIVRIGLIGSMVNIKAKLFACAVLHNYILFHEGSVDIMEEVTRLKELDTMRFQGRVPIEPGEDAELPPSDASPSAQWLKPTQSADTNREGIAKALWDAYVEKQQDHHQVAPLTEARSAVAEYAEYRACTYARTCQPSEQFRARSNFVSGR
jgi:hypothetical protein